MVSRQPNLRYHAANSINNLVRHSLPAIVELILNDDSAEFGARLLRNVVEFIFRLMNVLVLCVGRLVAGTFLVDMLMRALSSDNRNMFFFKLFYIYSKQNLLYSSLVQTHYQLYSKHKFCCPTTYGCFAGKCGRRPRILVH